MTSATCDPEMQGYGFKSDSGITWESSNRIAAIAQSGTESQRQLFPPIESPKRRKIEKFATPEPVDPNPPAHYQESCSLQGSPARTNSVIDPVKKSKTVCVQEESMSSSPAPRPWLQATFQMSCPEMERASFSSAYSCSIELDACQLQTQPRTGRHEHKEEYFWAYHDSPSMSARHDRKPITPHRQINFETFDHHAEYNQIPVPEDEVDKLMSQWTTLDVSEFVQRGI
jgi:hypothetical protein